MTFFADVGDQIKALVSGGRKLDSPGYSGGSSGTGYGVLGGFHWGNQSPGAGINYAVEAGELRFNSIVAACLQRRYQAISAAPPYLAQKNAEGGWDRVESHPLQELLDVPNGGKYGRNDLWGATDGSRCAQGSGFWRINWLSDHSLPGEILWESNAAPIYDEQNFVKEYRINTGRGQDTYAAAGNFDWRSNRDFRPAVVQFRHQLDPFNPRLGWSPLQTVLRQIATDNGLSSSLAAVVRNAAMPGWGITGNDTGGVEGFVLPADVEQVRTMLDKLTRGEGAGRTVGTASNLKFQKLTLNPDEVASPKINSFDVERICAVLGVPPLLIGLNTDSNSTYANQEQADKKFWHFMLLEMDSMGDALEGQVFPLYRDLNRNDFCIMWDTSQIAALKESEDAKFTRAQTGTNKAAFLTVNEARGIVGLSKIEKPEYDEIPSAQPEPEQGADEAAAKSLGRSFATHLTQPRDDLGRWTTGGTLNATHVATVLRSEGVHESRHGEVLGKIASGEHTTRAQVLGHIDEIHATGRASEPKGNAWERNSPGAVYRDAGPGGREVSRGRQEAATAYFDRQDEQRNAEREVWRSEIRGAVDRGEITAATPGLSADARGVVHDYQEEKKRGNASQTAIDRIKDYATQTATARGLHPSWVSNVHQSLTARSTEAEVNGAIDTLLRSRKFKTREPKPAHLKSIEDMQVLDALPAPEPLLDPNGVALSDAEIEALEDTENPESIALAYGRATVAKRAILGAQEARREAKSFNEADHPRAADGKFGSGGAQETELGGVHSKAFKNWFGDSKVVNPDGTPMVVYHGVPADQLAKLSMDDIRDGEVFFRPKFNAFDPEHKTEPGIYFSPDIKVAQKYGTPVAFYLKAENPIQHEAPLTEKPEEADSIFRMRSSKQGIHNAWEIAVFDPRQIKAVLNDGTFDPNNPDFHKSLGGR